MPAYSHLHRCWFQTREPSRMVHLCSALDNELWKTGNISVIAMISRIQYFLRICWPSLFEFQDLGSSRKGNYHTVHALRKIYIYLSHPSSGEDTFPLLKQLIQNFKIPYQETHTNNKGNKYLREVSMGLQEVVPPTLGRWPVHTVGTLWRL